MNREELVNIFNDTLEMVERKYPTNTVTPVYYSGNLSSKPTVNYPDIKMVRGGTVSTGYTLAGEGKRVAILNFADALVHGGLVTVGEATQEENICRCSNLYPVLGSKESYEAYYDPNWEFESVHKGLYLNNVIYARDITVFRDDETYKEIEPRKLDVITCPAPCRSLIEQEAEYIYTMRIQQIVLSAKENGAESLVLGAWGCGAFGQNPSLVARAFAVVLNWYSGYFKQVVFAIRSTPDSKDSSYDIFYNTLKADYLGGVYEE